MTPQLQRVTQRPEEMTIFMDQLEQNLPILQLIILNAREWMTKSSISNHS